MSNAFPIGETTHQLRRVPKRQMLSLSADHPDALFAAGFYEAKNRAGEVFPHWHGGVCLRPGEEGAFRRLLWECIGQDADAPLMSLDQPRTTRPLITLPNAKPTFHLAALTTPTKYISYANKQTTCDDIEFSTTRDFLA